MHKAGLMGMGFLTLPRRSRMKALSCWSCKSMYYCKRITVDIDSGVDFDDPDYGFKEEDKAHRKVKLRRVEVQV